MRLVAKIGTSSMTDALGVIDEQVIDTLCDQLAALRAVGHEVILVVVGRGVGRRRRARACRRGPPTCRRCRRSPLPARAG